MWSIFQNNHSKFTKSKNKRDYFFFFLPETFSVGEKNKVKLIKIFI